jgi:hypothetical protein
MTASFTVSPAPVPTLTTINPSTGVQGGSVPVTLTGANFVAGATVSVSNPGIAVSNATVVGATQITATFTIAANAAPGAASVSVTTSGGTSGTASFTVNPPVVAAPAFSPAGGTYTTAQPVTLSTATSGATIRYTTDGSTPTDSYGLVYTGPITVSSANTINAIGCMSGSADSPVASATYTVQVPSGMPFVPVLGDTFVASGSPTVYGNSVGLVAGGGNSALIEFNVSALPPGVTASSVRRATLSLWIHMVSTAGSVAIAQVTSPWTEGSATFGNAPTAGAIQGVVAVTQAASWVTLDITGLVESWIATPSANYGVQIAPSASNPNTVVQFDSKEAVSDAHPARLDIVLNAATPLVTATVADTYVAAEVPSQAFGSAVSLFVGAAPLGASSLLAFDLSGLPAGTVASDVNQAILFLWEKSQNFAGTLGVSQIVGPWTETTVTFNTAPSTGPVQSTYTTPGIDQWLAADATGMVQAWVANPAANFGIALSPSPSSSVNVAFDSKESATTKDTARLMVLLQAGAPSFSPVAGTYGSAQTVTISSTTSGATIRYTTDGSTPSETAGKPYTGPVTIGNSTTLTAIAYKSGMMDSAVASAVYTITQ